MMLENRETTLLATRTAPLVDEFPLSADTRRNVSTYRYTTIQGVEVRHMAREILNITRPGAPNAVLTTLSSVLHSGLARTQLSFLSEYRDLCCVNDWRIAYTRTVLEYDNDAAAIAFLLETDVTFARELNFSVVRTLHLLKQSGYKEYVFALAKKIHASRVELFHQPTNTWSSYRIESALSPVTLVAVALRYDTRVDWYVARQTVPDAS